MQKPATQIQLEVGGVPFKVLNITICAHEGYLKALITNNQQPIYYIDRDPLCFPLVLNYLRGYTMKRSLVDSLYFSTELSREDFYMILYEDANFYGLEGFIREVEIFLYEQCPSLIKDISEVEKYFQNDAKFAKDKEEVFKSVTTLIESCLEYVVDYDDRVIGDQVSEYMKLTEQSPLKTLKDAEKKLQECKDYIEFRNYTQSLLSLGMQMLVEGLEKTHGKNLQGFIPAFHNLIRRNNEFMKELFYLMRQRRPSAIMNMAVKTVMTFITYWMRAKKVPTEEEMTKAFQTVLHDLVETNQPQAVEPESSTPSENDDD
jgi:hypothetical protein